MIDEESPSETGTQADKFKILKLPVTRMSSYVNNLENIVATWYIIKASKCWPLKIKLAENDIQNWLYSD